MDLLEEYGEIPVELRQRLEEETNLSMLKMKELISERRYRLFFLTKRSIKNRLIRKKSIFYSL